VRGSFFQRSGMNPLRVMTFNIRNSGAADGPNRWPLRRALWTDVVRRFDPDLLGVQEVLPDQFDDLKTAFPGYGLSGVGRDDGDCRGERAMILHRSARFDPVDAGTFWLSENPQAIASVSWDSCLCRVCSWVRLTDRGSGRKLLFANTHFDHIGVTARIESAKLLVNRLPEIAGGAPVILTGDFNSTEDDAPYRQLAGTGRLTDSYRAVHPVPADDEASFHNFSGTTQGRRIDWIFAAPELTATSATIDRTRGPAGQWPSDHDAVTATFDWA
jgi:endonuclease/exonuclease/phosphatase family metal-dependent hydrolase